MKVLNILSCNSIADTADTSDGSREQASAKTDRSDTSLYNNNPEKIDRVKHEMSVNDLSETSKNADTYIQNPSKLSALSILNYLYLFRLCIVRC